MAEPDIVQHIIAAGRGSFNDISAALSDFQRRLVSLTNQVNGATVTEEGTSRTNTDDDKGDYVRWTSTSAKTLTVEADIAAAGDVWSGINAGATGNLTVAAGSGVTLTGLLIFAPGKPYTIRFSSAVEADVIGGTAT